MLGLPQTWLSERPFQRTPFRRYALHARPQETLPQENSMVETCSHRKGFVSIGCLALPAYRGDKTYGLAIEFIE